MTLKHSLYILALLIGIGALGAAVWFGLQGTSSHDDTAIADHRGEAKVFVVLTDAGFEPRYVRITQGTQVVFTTTRANQFWPASDPHPSHSIYPEFDPKEPIMPDSSWSFIFDKVGEWGYHDHLRSYFTGTIYVTPQ